MDMSAPAPWTRVQDTAKTPEEPPVPLFSTPPANVLVMHGNILYDWSQVLAETKAEPWRPVLDKATEKFKASGAPEADIRAALKNHSRREELDLGPDPEPPVRTPEHPAQAAAHFALHIPGQAACPGLSSGPKGPMLCE
eukprot:1155224-Pelagomonas_calceolata.AAC.15